MNQTTKETRRRSYDAVLPKRAARCRLILETLGNRELTASEITEELVAAGRIPYFNRNYVATPEDTEHGESWSTASEAIFKKYNELLEKLIPGEPEPIVTPYLPAVLSIGDAIAMPLRDNIPDPPTDDWQLTTCPACGAECWQTDTVRRILEQEPKVRTVCTACALKGLGK